MAGIPQTLPVPPLVNEMTMLNAIRLAAAGGGSGGSTAWVDITGKPATIDTLATGFGPIFLGTPLVSWNGLDYELYSGTIPAYLGGTGVANGLSSTLTLPNAATTITGGGTLGLGGFTLTVPATGTAALLGISNTFTIAGAASAPAMSLTGALFTGGSATTTKPLFSIEPSGTTSTGWDTAGTGLGINLPTAFAGKAISVQKQGVQVAAIWHNGIVEASGLICGTLYDAGGVSCATLNGSTLQVGGSILAAGGEIDILNDTFGINLGTSQDLKIRRKAAAILQLGADAAGVTDQMFTAASRITSDGVGANLTIAGGNGRGGAGGSLTLSTYDTGAAATAGTLRSRMTFDTAGAVSFPVVTAVTTETVISDTTWPVTINGVAYKICLKA